MQRKRMEDEMQSKHLEKKKLRKQIRSVSIQSKSCVIILLYTILLQKINRFSEVGKKL